MRDREADFAEWFGNTVLPDVPQVKDIAHEAFCAGWEARRRSPAGPGIQVHVTEPHPRVIVVTDPRMRA